MKIFKIIAFFGVFVIAFVIFFNRSPSYDDVKDELNVVRKPSDGSLVRIKDDGEYIMFQWFLNLLDIHTQYFPVSGQVINVERISSKNRHFAFNHDDVHNNQKIITTIKGDNDLIFIVEQIAGKFTNRIDNFQIRGSKGKVGNRLGHILLGSTVVLRVPKQGFVMNPELVVDKSKLPIMAKVGHYEK